MRKNVYNKKTSKVFIVIIIAMLLLNFIFPNFAMADVVTAMYDGGGATGSIQAVVNSMTTTGNSEFPTVMDKVGLQQQEIENLISKVIEKIESTFPDLEEGMAEKACHFYKDEQNMIRVKCTVGGSNGGAAAQIRITGFNVTLGSELSQSKIEGDVGELTLEEIEKINTETGSLPPSSAATGQDPDGETIIKDPEPGSAADELGGILLEPLFSLINFVADAITSVLGSLMHGDGISLKEYAVLTKTKFEPEQDKHYEEVEVAVDGSGLLELIDPKYPNIKYTPEEIFAGKIPMLSIDFISGKNAEGEKITGDWANIRSVVSQWYQVLRMIAIIGLLSVLIYTGIKIIISANAKDKAKYKEWIINWIMAAAILFSMHIIMAFIISVTGEFSKLISDSFQGIVIKNTADGGAKSATNLMGLVRFMIQSDSFVMKVGYEVMYIALLVYTIKFTFVYLKRVLNMAFLTLIAPIVALTYPIDKINDGKAQGFDMWIKEYIFNALLQPMHLILYYVLVGSAASIAASNPIYGIVVLAFMSEAEKLLKKIFGFEKAGAGTVGGMAGAFAAGALASNIKNIAGMAGKVAGKGGGAGSGDDPNALPDAKPLKDGAVENDFSNNLLGDGGASSGGDQPDADSPDVDSPDTDSPDADSPDADLTDTDSPDADSPDTDSPDADSPDADSPDTDSPSADSPSADSPKPQAPANRAVDNGESIREKAARVGAGLKSVGKAMLRPIYDVDRKGTGYNKKRWTRRGVKALKGLGKAAIGVGLGTVAAAVQTGISITDGKYNAMEGLATFSAGFAGGKGLASSVGGKVSGAFKEGYYSGDKGQEAAIQKWKDEFLYSADTEKAYRQKYGEKAETMKKLAAEQCVAYGYKETKDQFAMLKYAQHITDNSGGKVGLEDALKHSRRTIGFIGDLEKQGQKGLIGDPAKQDKYIESIIKSKNATGADADKIRAGYQNAFKSAAQWYQVN